MKRAAVLVGALFAWFCVHARTAFVDSATLIPRHPLLLMLAGEENSLGKISVQTKHYLKKYFMQQTQPAIAIVPHPLHPLTAEEINAVTAILREEKKLGYLTTRFVSITLKPSSKDFIYAYKKGQPFEREAFAVVLDSVTGQTYETVVSLTSQSVLSWEHIPGVQPTMTA
ncbi:MAG: hypothetical protein ABIN89_02470, partial [Chitinophagaceae bacterium]